jgi:lipopolysaccharide/colanic/teichoic acid biosynthesis glycosyltransferase
MKRSFDLFVAIAMLVLLTPPFLLLMLVVRLKIGSPIFFVQMRSGLYGKPFRMMKLRTMTNSRDSNGNLLPDDNRLTSFGRWLRATSLDELPELWNVVQGHMSLVGPRPLLIEYLNLYTPEQARRHDVRPGITGWAQVNGRNAIEWDEKFKLDTWYVDNQSFWLDIRILLLTIKKVFIREGVFTKQGQTMEKYNGKKKRN